MKKSRIELTCKICSEAFQVRPCEAKAYATCSKACAFVYRSQRNKTRLVTWGQKISEGLKNSQKERDVNYVTDEYRQQQREAAIARGLGRSNKGKKLSMEHRAKISASQIGHARSGWKLSEQKCAEMSERFKGEKSTFWRGGRTALHALERSSRRYRQWRMAVFARDGYKCVWCGATKPLNADHIKPFALFAMLRYEVSNGRTLCEPCHRSTETYGGRTARKSLFGIDVRLSS